MDDKQILKATQQLKMELVAMIITKWNERDFVCLEDVGKMADDILNVFATVSKTVTETEKIKDKSNEI